MRTVLRKRGAFDLELQVSSLPYSAWDMGVQTATVGSSARLSLLHRGVSTSVLPPMFDFRCVKAINP